MDDQREAREDFGRGEKQWSGSLQYEAEYRRLEQERARAFELPPAPQTPSAPPTPGGAAATVALLVVGYFAISIVSGNSPAVAGQLFMLGGWLIFLAAVFLVPFITISPLTRSVTGLQGEAARAARRKAFLVLGIGLGLGRLLNSGLTLGMMIVTAAVASAVLAYLLGKLMPMRTAAALAVINAAGVVVIDMAGASLLAGLLIKPLLA